MKIDLLCPTILIILVSNALSAEAITKTREADVLNLNGIQDGDGASGLVRGRDWEREKSVVMQGKDPTVKETQENRSFFKPEADRRGSGGSFYPSGPPLGPGSSFGSSPPYHSSGNGYSYNYGGPSGPSSDYPPGPPVYGSSYPARPISPSSSPPSSHSGFGGGLGGSYPHGSGGGLGGGYPQGHGGGLSGGYPMGSGGGGHSHAMMLKGLLLPIAGVALLGAAAVLAKSNPVLLQLGVVSGKRRRREIRERGERREEYPENPFVRPEKKD